MSAIKITRAQTIVNAKTQMQPADMVAIAAITGRKADRMVAAPHAYGQIRRLVAGHLMQNVQASQDAMTAMRAVTLTEGAVWDCVWSMSLGTLQGARQLERLLLDPVGTVRGELERIIALQASVPAAFRAAGADPAKTRKTMDTFVARDHKRVILACAGMAQALNPEFERAREAAEKRAADAATLQQTAAAQVAAVIASVNGNGTDPAPAPVNASINGRGEAKQSKVKSKQSKQAELA
jgi:hypothetical protein